MINIDRNKITLLYVSINTNTIINTMKELLLIIIILIAM